MSRAISICLRAYDESGTRRHTIAAVTGSTPAFGFASGVPARAAVSITFDDGRPSQLERAVPLLDRHGLRGTFFVLPEAVEVDIARWRRAAEAGHEIGAHTATHPCSANFEWSRGNALEDYTLERMESELAAADDALESLLGRRPRSFAYPCGQRFVGRGEHVRSYVPLVARRYVAGRGYKDERPADPAVCDLAQVPGVLADGCDAAALCELVDDTRRRGAWLVLVAHEVGDSSQERHTVGEAALDALCSHVRGRGDVWVDTVARVAESVLRSRVTSRSG
jgi:peptidoglycan-N-acetylglucosamine deacetylase